MSGESGLIHAAEEETPLAIEITKGQLKKLQDRLSEGGLFDKFDVKPSNTPGKVKISSPDAENLQTVLQKIEAPDTPAGSGGGAAGAADTKPGLADNKPSLADTLGGGGGDGDGGGDPPLPDTDNPSKWGLGAKTALGAGAVAGVGGAAYGLSGSSASGAGPVQGASAKPPETATGAGPSGIPLANAAGIDGSEAVQRGVASRYGDQPTGAFQMGAPKPQALGSPLALPQAKTDWKAQHFQMPDTADAAVQDLLDNPPKSADGTNTTDGSIAKMQQASNDKWAAQLKEISNVAREAQRTNKWAEVAETVGHALTRFFAARTAMNQQARSGYAVNPAALQLDKHDWFKENQLAIEQMKADAGIVDSNRTADEKQISNLRDALDKYHTRLGRAEQDRDRLAYDTSRGNAELDAKAMDANAAGNRENTGNAYRLGETQINADSRLSSAEERARAAERSLQDKLDQKKVDGPAAQAAARDARTRKQAVGALGANWAGMKDGDRKTRDDLEKREPELEGKTGLDPSVLQALKQRAHDEDHWYNTTNEYDQRASYLQTEIAIQAVMDQNPGARRADVLQALKSKGSIPKDYRMIKGD